MLEAKIFVRSGPLAHAIAAPIGSTSTITASAQTASAASNEIEGKFGDKKAP
jgi:hypothetical protein